MTKKIGRKSVCKCSCGNNIIVFNTNLQQGNTKSCGCLRKEKLNTTREKPRYKGTNIGLLNAKLSKANTSGYKGISWDKNRNKWAVQINCQCKRHFLGRYNTLELAIKARKLAEEKYFEPLIEEYKEVNQHE